MKKILLILALCTFLYGQNPLSLGDDLVSISLDKTIEFLEDEADTLAIDDFITSSKQVFQKLDQFPNRGFSRSAFWVRFTVKNNRNKAAHPMWVLKARSTEIDYLDFYQLTEDEQIQKSVQTGSMKPVETRDRQDAIFVFLFSIPQGQTHTIYLKIKTTSTVVLSFTINSMDQYLRTFFTTALTFGVFIGILLLAIGYYSVIFVRLKDNSFLYLVLSGLALLLNFFATSGFGAIHIWPHWRYWDSISIPFFDALLFIFFLKFVLEFLELKKYSHTWNHILNGMIYLFFILVLMIFFIDLYMIRQIINAVMTLTLVLIMMASYLPVKAGYKPAKFFFIGIVLICSTGFYKLIIDFGLLPINALGETGYKIASVFLIWFFSQSISDRIYLFKSEKEMAESELYKRVEDLRKSEEKFRLYMENSHDGVLIVGSDFRFEYGNAELSRILGYPLNEIIGEDFRNFLDENSRRLVADNYIRRQRGETVPSRYEFSILRKNGEKRDVEISSAVTQDSEGDIKTIASLLDITDRNRALEETRRTRKYIDNIINSMPSVLISIDAEGRVTHWNEEAEKTTGIDKKSATGQPLEKVFPRMKREMDNIRNSIRSKQIIKASKIMDISEERAHYSDITVYPLLSNGIEGAVIRVDDVTERVRLEEMMIQSEKMLSVGGLAAGMAHEINNPLAGMLQTAQVLINRLSSKIPANITAAEESGTTLEAIQTFMEKRKILIMLQSIQETGQRAAKIVDNMLGFSRKSESILVPHDITRLLDDTVELAKNDYDLKKKYDFRRIGIRRKYEDGLPMVNCERSNIQQVFLNILKNGAQAMAEDKINEKGIKNKEEDTCFILRVRRNGEMIRIEIEDNGPGMDEESCRRAFEPFYTTKEVGVGTGLGLSVSYFIITEQHKGKMAIESTQGKGTKVIIHIPGHGN